jgi:hypothetical protein
VTAVHGTPSSRCREVFSRSSCSSAHPAVQYILGRVSSEPDPDVPSLGRALLTALLLLVGAALIIGVLILILATQLPGEFLS